MDFFSQAFNSLDDCKPRETNILKWKLKCVSRGSVGSDSFEYFSGWYVESLPSFPKIQIQNFTTTFVFMKAFFVFFNFHKTNILDIIYLYIIYMKLHYNKTYLHHISLICFGGNISIQPPFPWPVEVSGSFIHGAFDVLQRGGAVAHLGTTSTRGTTAA